MGMGRPAGSRAELMSRVQAAVEGTAYTLVPTHDGFDVHTNTSSGSRNAAARFTHYVRLDERTRTLTITDEMRGRDAQGGRSAQRGRYSHRSFEKTYGRREDGAFGKVGERRFRSDDGRRLIEDAATALGWTLKRSGAEKAGLIAAVIGAGVAGLVLIAGVLVLVVVLLL